MRHVRYLSGCCALVILIASVVPAGAQSGFQTVTDSKGLFSIALPTDWRVAGSEFSDTVFQGLQGSQMGGSVISTLAAHSNFNEPESLAILAVVALDIPQRVPPAAFGEYVRAGFPSNWTMTQDGRATIAGREAYYVYFVMNQRGTPLYMVMSYFPVGRTGFLVAGGTLNEPSAIQRNFATISRILETFRPSAKLGGSAAR